MKSKNNNLVKQLNNSMNVVNNNVRKVVQNELLINVIRVLLIIYASFIVPMLKNHQLNIVNNNFVRLVILLIVYLSFMDVIKPVLLTIAFVVTLHRTNNQANNNNTNNQKINDVNLQPRHLVFHITILLMITTKMKCKKCK